MQDSSHQARKLGAFRPITGASPAFAERHPELRHPYDLRSVPYLIYLRQPTPFQWAFCGDDGKRIIVEVTGQYRVDVFEALCDAAVAGLGVLRAPVSACGEDLRSGRLVRLLPEFDADVIPIYAVMPASSWIPHKTRAMVDFLIEEFRTNPWLNGLGDEGHG